MMIQTKRKLAPVKRKSSERTEIRKALRSNRRLKNASRRSKKRLIRTTD
jgi:predicted GIY-YIG superfamily endonuclease